MSFLKSFSILRFQIACKNGCFQKLSHLQQHTRYESGSILFFKIGDTKCSRSYMGLLIIASTCLNRQSHTNYHQIIICKTEFTFMRSITAFCCLERQDLVKALEAILTFLSLLWSDNLLASSQSIIFHLQCSLYLYSHDIAPLQLSTLRLRVCNRRG